GYLNANGIYISIPAQAFPDTSRVRIRLVVLREPRDFILAGVPLNLKQGNRHILLESVGMFHIDFRDAITDRSIEPQTEIAAYAAITDTNVNADVQNARVYYRSDDSNDWIEKSTFDNEVDGAGGSPVVSMELDGGFGLYAGIDKSGWWNFDIPKPEITCLRGTVARSDVHVFAAGLSYNGLDQVVPDAQGHFRINALKNETVKVYAVQARRVQTSGENRLVPLEIGQLQPLTTHDVTAHTSDPATRCMAIGHVDMHGIDAGIAGNRKRLLELLGLPDNTN
ncbi:MAG: hypothetical protein KDK34_06130, partial [Leptospiraceae bacterium]|nr:hypothetical protein [Leptospiraceae bacterium]